MIPIVQERHSLTAQISQHRAFIMGFSILSIMLFHQYYIDIVPFNIFHIFGYWGVDIFLFLSGMGLVNSLKKNTLKNYYKRRFVRLAPSCILCGSIKYAIFITFGSSLIVLKESLHLGIWSIASLDLWFIHTIIILYLISPLLYKALSKCPYATSMVILWIFIISELTIRSEVGFNWMTPTGVTAWTIERLLVFCAGMMVSVKQWEIGRKISLSLVFLLLGITLVLLSKIHISFNGTCACMHLCLTLGMPAILFLCIMTLKIVPKPCYKSFVFLGEHSLELYLVHEFIFWALKISFEGMNPYGLFVVSIMLSCLAAYGCKLVTNKICHL